MSTWRDIWKRSLKANRLMSIDIEKGEAEFAELARRYETEKKDGMIHYAYAEALEYRNEKEKALKEYTIARDLFPVEHWKKVAEHSIKRLNNNQTAEDYCDKENFISYLWYTYQKVYEYVYLDDFVRYVCLSAISRADSEWPLSLVDFRSVLELQIKTTFSDLVKPYIEKKEFILSDIIDDLKTKKGIDETIIRAMHGIRISGNAATHELKTFDEDDFENYRINNYNKDDLQSLNNLQIVLEFFNTYNKKHNIQFPE